MTEKLINRMLNSLTLEERRRAVRSAFNKDDAFMFNHILSKEDIKILESYVTKIDPTLETILDTYEDFPVYFGGDILEFDVFGNTPKNKEEEDGDFATITYNFTNRKLDVRLDWKP